MQLTLKTRPEQSYTLELTATREELEYVRNVLGKMSPALLERLSVYDPGAKTLGIYQAFDNICGSL